MSTEISTAFNQQYTTNVQLLLQQRGSKLERAVGAGSYQGKAAKVVEQIGQVAAQERVSRHSDIQIVNTPHDARWVFPKDFELGDYIDDPDKLKMLISPESSYAMNHAIAMGRAKDNQIISAFFGTSKTGENGSTSTAFDTSNQQIAASSAGLTVAKLREAKRILESNEVDTEFDPLYIAVTARQMDDLLGTTEVTSKDYNAVQALVDGTVSKFMGFEFIRTELLTVDGSSNRRVAAWAKSGMHLGMWNNVHTSINVIPTKSNSTLVATYGTFGATRIEEGKVIEILCSEA